MNILHPLKVTDCDTAGVGQNVRNHYDVLLEEDFIRLRGGRPIGGFGNNTCQNAISVGRCDNPFSSCGDQYITGNLQYIMHPYRLGARESNYTSPLLFVAQDRRWLKAGLVIDTTVSITHGYYFTTLVMEEPCSDGAGVAKALNANTSTLQRHINTLCGLTGHE